MHRTRICRNHAEHMDLVLLQQPSVVFQEGEVAGPLGNAAS